jgi:phosphoribosyl 1,2-cyclic phosphodiesterase
MNIRLRGVRGSSPTPLTPEAVQSKIAAAIQRVKPSDLVSPESRELFLSRLPEYIFGTTGGNTACIEVRLCEESLVILDCGTGLRELERSLRKRKDKVKTFHIFFSHFHYDHILGLPYFGMMYDPEVTVHFYSPYPKMEEILRNFMVAPYHPVTFDSFNAKCNFHLLKGNTLDLPGGKIFWIKRNHPNGSFAYKIEQNDRSFIYSSDTELRQEDFNRSKKNIKFFERADALVLDAQYTLGEAFEKYDWGHSSYSMAVDFAIEFGISELYLFHHEPLYDDKKMSSIQRSARWYTHRSKGKPEVNVQLAVEGLNIEL